MTCINCKKKLKSGEFVVLNGGAMIKTKTGATMGDKRHLGFLTVNNHFDSKKNYRTMVIADNCSNGQFEFYACSHKCLTDFMTRQIMTLEKFDKIRKIEIASQTKLDKVGYEWGLKVVNLMGFKGALITDESTVGDFLNCKKLEKISKKLGFKVNYTDYIWKIARKYKNKVLSKNA